jgi:hypothetical protein
MIRWAILPIVALLALPAAAGADVLSNTGDGIYAAMTPQDDGSFRATWVERQHGARVGRSRPCA